MKIISSKEVFKFGLIIGVGIGLIILSNILEL